MSLSSRLVPHTRAISVLKAPFSRQNITNRHPYATTAKMTVQRITMFKVANEADIPKFFEKYQALEKEQRKVSKIQNLRHSARS